MTNTRMQRDYHEGRLQLMSQDEYVKVICDQLEIIPKHIVIHRITICLGIISSWSQITFTYPY